MEVHAVAGAGATSPTGLRRTGISRETLAALGATPARITYTAEPEGGGSQGRQVGREARGGRVMRWEKASPFWRIMADTVIAGLLGTGMAWGQAQWRQGARRAKAVETTFPIHTGAALPAGAGRTLVDLHVAERPWGAHRPPQPKARTTQPTERDALEQGHPPSHNTSALLQTRTATPQPRASLPPDHLHPQTSMKSFSFSLKIMLAPLRNSPAPSEQPYLRSRINSSQYGDNFVTNRETIRCGQSHWPSQCRDGQNLAKKDGRFHPHPLRPPSRGSPLPTCEARLADTVIAIDTIPANSEGAGVAGTIVDVHLTVHTCRRRTRQG